MQGQPGRVGEQVVLRPRFPAVGGVRAGQLAPLLARTDTASILARDQSRISCSESSSSTARCSFSHTPAPCHCLSRRQAVCPDPQPRAGGRSRQRHPVCSTNRIPSSAARSSIRGRPPGPRGGGWGGISGAISSHRRSSTIHDCVLVVMQALWAAPRRVGNDRSGFETRSYTTVVLVRA